MRVLTLDESNDPPLKILQVRYSVDSTRLAIRGEKRLQMPRSWKYEWPIWLWDVNGIPSRCARKWKLSRSPITFDELATGKPLAIPELTTPGKQGRRRSTGGQAKAVSVDTFAAVVQYWDLEHHLPHVYAVLVRNAGSHSTTVVAEWSSRMKVVDRIELTPDGTRVAVQIGKIIHVWDVTSAAELTALKLDRLRPNDFAFSGDGRYLGVLFQDSVSLYDTASWTVAKTYSWKVGKLRSLAFSPDGATAAVGSDTGQVVVFDLE